jgi:uncharacterized protein (UPF0276 family)
MPACAGIGLRARHHAEVLREQPAVGWLEVHSENYFGAGGAPQDFLDCIGARYPLSLHGVGLSLGSTDALDLDHLAELGRAVRRFRPRLVSEHLAWSSAGGRFANDLLPLPYTDEALELIATRIRAVQNFLGRRILIENVSSYVEFAASCMSEWDFLATLAAEADCDILLDVNNVYVSAHNHGFDAGAYLDALPPSRVQEIHLAGHSRTHIDGVEMIVDTHAAPVSAGVWELYARALRRFGPVATLIEWDAELPALEVLVAEAHRAEAMLRSAEGSPRSAEGLPRSAEGLPCSAETRPPSRITHAA